MFCLFLQWVVVNSETYDTAQVLSTKTSRCSAVGRHLHQPPISQAGRSLWRGGCGGGCRGEGELCNAHSRHDMAGTHTSSKHLCCLHDIKLIKTPMWMQKGIPVLGSYGGWMAAEGGPLSFRNVVTSRFIVTQWIALNPCIYGQR